MATACLLTLALSGCGTLGLRDDDLLVTGSIKPLPVSLAVAAPEGAPPAGIAAGDWTQAKLALDTALSAKEEAPSIPWENKATGAHGTATPLGAPKDNKCRDFRIGVVDKGGEHWVQGEACRDGKGLVTLGQVRLLGQA
ncbi:RT0821/Lpp0805 family surface protein [Azorhizobium doebereinerae]|uniref:RT0821/Lpp0805 family surface protein n=1 Tax=Azorhizobium doebereinerae TaxID=281091 RepID=UPI0018DBC188|nr:RT0821/Lpp0805 family surface protein [Azorhizobium doebereinerae]